MEEVPIVVKRRIIHRNINRQHIQPLASKPHDNTLPQILETGQSIEEYKSNTKFLPPKKQTRQKRLRTQHQQEKCVQIAGRVVSLQRISKFKQLQTVLMQIPNNLKTRSFQEINLAVSKLRQNNTLFNKIGYNCAKALVSNMNFKRFLKGQIIYKRLSDLQGFFFVLAGKAQVIHIMGDYSYKVPAGQTLGEQILFKSSVKRDESITNFQFAQARKASLLGLLRLGHYQELKEQLINSGYKIDLLTMQNLIRRIYLAHRGCL